MTLININPDNVIPEQHISRQDTKPEVMGSNFTKTKLPEAPQSIKHLETSLSGGYIFIPGLKNNVAFLKLKSYR